MIISRIYGGIGNQLFQYAAGRYISDPLGTIPKLDINEYNLKYVKGTKRTFGIHELNLPWRPLSKNEKKIASLYHNRITRKIFSNWPWELTREKQAYRLQDISGKSNKDIYLDGYWQCFDYAKFVIPEISGKMHQMYESMPPEIRQLADKMGKNNSVSVHFRRGDYANDEKISSIHGIMNNNYYRNAIDHICERFTDVKFYIFSDEPDWVKSNFSHKCKFHYVENQKLFPDYYDLVLMSMCKHNIIANSSFSWWGAALNSSKNKQVIYPSQWIKGIKTKETDLMPEDWVNIDMDENNVK